jgi:tryptophan 2-monooxygenase
MMHAHFIPKIRATGTAGCSPWAYVDAPYDYMQILGSGRTIAALPASRAGATVAIVGAGVAGLVAAYELLKIGVRPVIFEATDRVGGRQWSRPFTENGKPTTAFAELGAMRFPACDQVFAHYVQGFNLATLPYPEPGSVPTLVYYNGARYDLAENGTIPPVLRNLQEDWLQFVLPLVESITQEQDAGRVRQIWQSYIGRYESMSIYEAIREGIPAWTSRECDCFGATGGGTGGLGSLYEMSFLEALRMYIRFTGTKDYLLQDGIDGLSEHFYTTAVTTPDGRQVSLRDLGAVRFNTRVAQIAASTSGNPNLTFTDPATGQTATEEYPAAIVAISVRSMEVLGLTLPAPSASRPVREEVKSALRHLHMVNSAKMFIRTATKFWRENPALPQAIVTDELPGMVGVFDYPQTENGVVMINYTWGTDAGKVVGLDVPTRFALFIEILTGIHPEFGRHLLPLNGEILHINWQLEPAFLGAYRLPYPGHDIHTQVAYFQFLSALDPALDRGIYLAGERIAWQGGWTESALHTGLNAACAAAFRLGATLPPNSPLSQDPALYTY